MSKISEFKFTDAYAPFFYTDKRYFVVSGGRASGKSKNVAAYFVMLLIGDTYFRGVISRYTTLSLKYSIYKDIMDTIEEWGLKSRITVNGSEIINNRNGNCIMTHSFKIGDNAQVAKSKGISNPTHLLIDEAQELPSEEEYIKIIDSFRTKDVKTQIFIVFNPGTKRHWIYKRFFLSDGVPKPKWEIDHAFIHTTYKDTIDHLDPKKVEEWERMKDTDIDYYDNHILGKWSQGKQGKIFNNWIVDYNPDPESNERYGLDFGFAGDPATLIKVNKHNKKMWLKELIYQSGLTNNDLFDLMVKHNVPLNAEIIADSSEPKSIEDLKRLGYKNVKACYKGPDSIRNGINKIMTYEVHADSSSENLWMEYDLYSWKDGTDTPIDKDNHLMDALRYTESVEPVNASTLVSSNSYERYKNNKQMGNYYLPPN